jgi:hypothetical protein
MPIKGRGTPREVIQLLSSAFLRLFSVRFSCVALIFLRTFIESNCSLRTERKDRRKGSFPKGKDGEVPFDGEEGYLLNERKRKAGKSRKGQQNAN